MKYILVVLLLSSCKIYTQKQVNQIVAKAVENERINATLDERDRWQTYHLDTVNPQVFKFKRMYLRGTLDASDCLDSLCLLTLGAEPTFK